MDELESLLNRKVSFHCTRRGGGDGTKTFEVVNTLGDPIKDNEIPDWAPPSLLSIYKKSHGLQFFQPSHDAEDGFRLFNVNEVAEEQEVLGKIFEENIDEYEEETEFEDLEKWLEGLIPIAEVMSSGDKFVLDTYNKKDNGECPIIFLDHEAYYGGACDPDTVEVIAQDTTLFLIDVLNNPLKYVASHWVGGDMNQQWYPDEIKIA